MPKIITAAMRPHLDEETTRLAAIWRITRKDGAQFFFTDHDRDIVFGGDTYRADAGFERTAIRSDAGFAVDNLDLVGVVAEGGIVEDEVRAASASRRPRCCGARHRLLVAPCGLRSSFCACPHDDEAIVSTGAVDPDSPLARASATLTERLRPRPLPFNSNSLVGICGAEQSAQPL